MDKLIINLAPTGMIPTKETTPYVPITPNEIVENVIECSKMGATMFHLHARDENGNPTYKKEIYQDIITKVRNINPELILIASTSGRTFQQIEKRSEVLQLEGDSKPDMASLTLSSMNFLKHASINSPDTIIELIKIMNEKDIKPELEVFDVGMINYAKYLIKKGLIKPPYYFNIILGNITSAQGSLAHLSLLISELPEQSIYSITGIGDTQKKITALGTILADGVRVGLEDNIWYDREKSKLATNMMLVEMVTKMSKAYNREIATAIDVRNRIGLF